MFLLLSRCEDTGMKAELLSPEEDPLALSEPAGVAEQEEMETHQMWVIIFFIWKHVKAPAVVLYYTGLKRNFFTAHRGLGF